ncbi:glucose-1-phosphate cytidylyltransferase [Oleispirillum naphthae]|uniref:glucose-1-phosphate cytidylyltransferase n=1 Tax=Oleispirillum naphthae TaxID=2838853 RepID=UPI0030825D6A
MKAVILCGGYGTRIRDVSEALPKPMLPIGDRPILWHIMKGYAAHGITEFVLCLGHLGHKIREYFLNYETNTCDCTVTLGDGGGITVHGGHAESGWKISLVDTGLGTMTGGRVRRVRPYVGDEPFCLTYGDGVTDLDIGALIAFHNRHGRLATVTGVRPPGRFGELTLSAEGRATGFNEKPQVSEGRISGGFFVFGPGVFDYLDDRDSLVLEEEPMKRLVQDGELMVHAHDGFWQCMDTPRDNTLLTELWASGRAPWKIW